MLALAPLFILFSNCSDLEVGSEEGSWSSEDGAGSVVSGQGLSGQLTGITADGRVMGWAMDENNSSVTATIDFYIGGARNQGGTYISSVLANRPGGGVRHGHFFSYELPSEFRTGAPFEISVYARHESRNLTLTQNQSYVAYTPTEAGRAYFQSTLAPLLVQRCASCHSVDYTLQYRGLILPSPFAGGSPTNNELIIKARGGASHGGGNRCGNVDSSPCREIQEWWSLEFN